jgi:hypothetical protein
MLGERIDLTCGVASYDRFGRAHVVTGQSKWSVNPYLSGAQHRQPVAAREHR